MSDQPAELQLSDNPAASRYEAKIDGQIAFAEYMLTGANITFTHTEVPVGLEGQGIGSALARFALDDARARGLAVIPLCPFIKAFIQRHREYQPLVFGYPGADSR
jgi:predicted GNAT family acetyltransferase